MGDIDIPWIYVAMVAIIFVRWLLGQFKRAAAIRERKRKVARRGWDETPPQHSPVYKPETPFEPAEQQQPPSRPTPTSTPEPRSLQELFEMRRREIAEAQGRATPPPVPKRTKEEEEPQPEIVVPHVSRRPAKPVVVAVPRIKNKLIDVISDGNQIRQAIILKEVLDSPKGLKL